MVNSPRDFSAALSQLPHPMAIDARTTASCWNLSCDASIDWQNSREFFGCGVISRLPHTERHG